MNEMSVCNVTGFVCRDESTENYQPTLFVLALSLYSSPLFVFSEKVLINPTVCYHMVHKVSTLLVKRVKQVAADIFLPS